MRSVLRASAPDIEVLAGRGEAIPLPDASADAVLISSAWHWLDPDLAVPEIGRVLREGGRLGVIWTGRDPATEWLRADDWFREVHQEAAVHACEAVLRRQRQHHEVTLPDPAMFSNIETAVFRFTRSMSAADVADMLTTYSRVITAAPEIRQAGRARAAAALAAQFPGADQIDVPMRSLCWRADRVGRAAG